MTLNIHFSTIYYYKIALIREKHTIFEFVYLRVLIILQRLLQSFVGVLFYHLIGQ